MTLPPLNPIATPSGIVVDPKTLERVIASSRRPDGSLRKELKVRPGFTPQEDVSTFRGTRQQEADNRKTARARGHIVGLPPPTTTTNVPKPGAGAATAPLGKSAKKNAKKKEKRAAELDAKIKSSWDDDDDDEPPKPASAKEKSKADGKSVSSADEDGEGASSSNVVDELNKEVDKLVIRDQ